MANQTSKNLSGNWTAKATWSGGGAPGSATVTADTDVVTLSDTTTTADLVTDNETPNPWYIGSLSISTTNTGTETLAIGANHLTVNGAVTLGSANSFLTLSGGGVTASSGFSNAGTISGAGTLTGAISGSGVVLASGGTLELASAVGSVSTQFQIAANSALQVDGSFASGDTVTFNSSSSGDLVLNDFTSGTPDTLGFSGTIAGLGVGSGQNTETNYLYVNATTITQATLSGANNDTLSLTDATGTIDTITLSGNYTGDFANWTAHVGGGSDVFITNAICFVAGTKIRTSHGEAAIESLMAGDLVATVCGDEPALRPVKWVGYRSLDLTRHPKPETAAPVRIIRGAFTENQPHRDLLVSPDHGLLIDGKLVPAKLLVNGTTIAQDRSFKTVTYYHIELEQHAILLAEGLPAESYLDTGNRAFFENAGLALVLHPEFQVNANLRCWQEDACAPLTVCPDVVGPIWHRLANRAATLGFTTPVAEVTADANVHLCAEGLSVRAVSVENGCYTFMLPGGVADLRLASRACAPSELHSYHDDPRRLGLAVSRIKVRTAANVHDIPLDHPAFSDGWHPVEQADGRMWRWTNGDAALPIVASSADPLVIELQLHPMGAYLMSKPSAPAQLAA